MNGEDLPELYPDGEEESGAENTPAVTETPAEPLMAPQGEIDGGAYEKAPEEQQALKPADDTGKTDEKQ